MARCRLIQGKGDNLIWNTVLCCDNPDCEFHAAKNLVEAAGVDRIDSHDAAIGALQLAGGIAR